ncbi:MAG: ABC transporter permease [Chloroflexaceae bacterium]|nr:ABC transporter permease [Chloroflexaceae bacterium]
MTFQDMLRTALENLGRRKVRTALTSTGVVVGILTIVTMVSLGVGVQREIREQFAALGLENVFVRPGQQQEQDFFTQFGPPMPAQPITPEVAARWERLPGVRGVTTRVNLDQVTTLLELPGGGARPVRVTGLDLIANPFRAPPVALAGTLGPLEGAGQVVLAAGTLPPGARPEDLLGREVAIVLRSPRGETERFPLTVVGVNNGADNEVQASTADMAAMKAWWFNTPDYLERYGYDEAVIRASDVAAATELVRALRSQGFRVQSLELILQQANRVFAVINVMLGSVGGLALFVASLGIVNTMIMAIYERTREIGTLKAIGASRGDIRGIFMLEAGLIGLIGGAIGIIGGWLIGILLNQVINWYIARERLPVEGAFFVTPWWLALAALAFAALVGIVAGLYPAARAARLDPLVALRYE